MVSRREGFQKVYDLPERLIPDAHRLRQVDEIDARRELLRQSATSLGVATLQDLADYYRMSPRVAALWRPAAGHTLRWVYARGSRAPTAAERFGRGR